jgi:hypothetical protein
MRWLGSLAFMSCAVLAVAACERQALPLSESAPPAPALAGPGPGPTGGALVGNSGEGHPEHEEVVCFFNTFTSTRGVSVRSPSGNNTLNCSFEGLPLIAQTEVLKGFLCTIVHAGTSLTSNTQWVRRPNGTAEMYCQFSDKPVFNAAVIASVGAASAQEGTFTRPLAELPSGTIEAELVDAGRGCNVDVLTNDPAGKIALVERGGCGFAEKLAKVEAAGAVAAVVYNSVAGGEDIVTMVGAPASGIPGVFVARSTGLGLKGAAPLSVTIRACGRSASCRGAL